MRRDMIEVVGFDADDTLWQCQDGFDEAERLFVDTVSPYASPELISKMHFVPPSSATLQYRAMA